MRVVSVKRYRGLDSDHHVLSYRKWHKEGTCTDLRCLTVDLSPSLKVEMETSG